MPPHPSQGSCNECACLFKHKRCPSERCMDVPETLGLNCSRADGPVDYVIQMLSNTQNRTDNVRRCLLERICGCLSRNKKNEKLESKCYELCMKPNSSDIMSMPMMETMYRNHSVCTIVNRQYCRRYKEKGRPSECARRCVQEESCVRDYITIQ